MKSPGIPTLPALKGGKIPLWLTYFFIVLWTLAWRVPMLYSPYAVLDGDECIVGLMGKHLLEGNEFVCFFYGQPYGFALPEAFLCGLGRFVFGNTALAVRWPMALLFSGCCCLLYNLLRGRLSRNQALCSALLFGVFPAWVLFSVKARGGYLCGLFFTLMCLNLLDSKRPGTMVNLFLSALAAALAALSHLLYVPGLLLVGVAMLFEREKNPGRVILPVLFSIFLYTILQCYLPALNPQAYGNPGHAWFSGDWLKALPENLFRFFTGWWGNTEYIDMSRVQKFSALFTLCFLLVALLSGIFLFLRRKGFPDLFSSSLLFSGLVGMAPLAAGNSEEMSYRYLLPGSLFLFLYACLLFVRFFNQRKNEVSFGVAFLFYLFLQNMYFMTYCYEPYPEKSVNGAITEQKIKLLVEALGKGKQQVFVCTDGLLQWQLVYYSDETIPVSYKASEGRYTRYTRAVQSSMALTGNAFLLGFRHDLAWLDGLPEATVTHYNQLFFTAGPYKESDIKKSIYLR